MLAPAGDVTPTGVLADASLVAASFCCHRLFAFEKAAFGALLFAPAALGDPIRGTAPAVGKETAEFNIGRDEVGVTRAEGEETGTAGVEGVAGVDGETDGIFEPAAGDGAAVACCC